MCGEAVPEVHLKRSEGAQDTAFYLQLLSKYSDSVWHSRKPVGHNKLASTVKKLCSQVGVDGYKTNHSLRRTAATRLFQAGCDEQLITGHRSTEGVRQYKEVSLQQCSAIQNPSKKMKQGEETQDSKLEATSWQDMQKSFSLNGSIQSLVINFQGKC